MSNTTGTGIMLARAAFAAGLALIATQARAETPSGGSGMDAATQARIFEPFFTTKGIGEGTGLGLSTVLGIVEQSGGAIRCESHPDRGTTFRIFLPAVAEGAHLGAVPAGRLTEAPRGSESVLLVEDEDAVRKLARRILEKSGYVVHEAATDAKVCRCARPTRGRSICW